MKCKGVFSINILLLMLCGLSVLSVSLGSCLDMAGDCETEISRRIFNPDRTVQAVSLVTDCGATTSPSYGIRLVEGADTTDRGTADNTILGSNSGVSIAWISGDSLIITGADTSSGYTMKTFLKLKNTDIKIIYRD